MLSGLLFCEPILFRIEISLISHTLFCYSTETEVSDQGWDVKTEIGSAASSAPSGEHLYSDCPVSMQITGE